MAGDLFCTLNQELNSTVSELRMLAVGDMWDLCSRDAKIDRPPSDEERFAILQSMEEVCMCKHFSNKLANVDLAADLVLRPPAAVEEAGASNVDDVDAMRKGAIGRSYSCVQIQNFDKEFFRDMGEEMNSASVPTQITHRKLMQALIFVYTNADCWCMPLDESMRFVLDPRSVSTVIQDKQLDLQGMVAIASCVMDVVETCQAMELGRLKSSEFDKWISFAAVRKKMLCKIKSSALKVTFSISIL